jgi:hypothetical protein
VQAAQVGDGLLDHLLRLLVVGDVARNRRGLPTGGLDLAHDLLGLLFAGPVVDADRRAAARQGARDRAADPTRPPGDERHPILESHEALIQCARSLVKIGR